MQKRHRQALTIIALLLWAGSALAAGAPPEPDKDLAGWLNALYAALTSKQWSPVVGLVLIGLEYPVRRWGPDLFKGRFAGVAIAFALSMLGTVSVTLIASQPLTAAVLLTALSTAATAAGVWEWIKDSLPGVKAASIVASTPNLTPAQRDRAMAKIGELLRIGDDSQPPSEAA